MTRQSAPARTINRIDDRGRPKGRDDIGQMLDVLDVDVDQHLEEIGVATGDLKFGDVPAVFADHGREGAEAAGLVGDDDTDAADMLDRIAATIPADIDPALRRVGEAFQRFAIDRVDRDALPRGHYAYDPVA